MPTDTPAAPTADSIETGILRRDLALTESLERLAINRGQAALDAFVAERDAHRATLALLRTATTRPELLGEVERVNEKARRLAERVVELDMWGERLGAERDEARAEVARLTKPGPATDDDLRNTWRDGHDKGDARHGGKIGGALRAVYTLGLAHGRSESQADARALVDAMKAERDEANRQVARLIAQLAEARRAPVPAGDAERAKLVEAVVEAARGYVSGLRDEQGFASTVPLVDAVAAYDSAAGSSAPPSLIPAPAASSEPPVDPERAKLVEAVADLRDDLRYSGAPGSAERGIAHRIDAILLATAEAPTARETREQARARFLATADAMPDPGTSLLATAEAPRFVPRNGNGVLDGARFTLAHPFENAQRLAEAMNKYPDTARAHYWQIAGDRNRPAPAISYVIDTAPPVDTAKPTREPCLSVNPLNEHLCALPAGHAGKHDGAIGGPLWDDEPALVDTASAEPSDRLARLRAAYRGPVEPTPERRAALDELTRIAEEAGAYAPDAPARPAAIDAGALAEAIWKEWEGSALPAPPNNGFKLSVKLALARVGTRARLTALESRLAAPPAPDAPTFERIAEAYTRQTLALGDAQDRVDARDAEIARLREELAEAERHRDANARERDERWARCKAAEAKVAELSATVERLTKPGPASAQELMDAWRRAWSGEGESHGQPAAIRAVYTLGLAHGRVETDRLKASIVDSVKRWNAAAISEQEFLTNLETLTGAEPGSLGGGKAHGRAPVPAGDATDESIAASLWDALPSPENPNRFAELTPRVQDAIVRAVTVNVRPILRAAEESRAALQRQWDENFARITDALGASTGSLDSHAAADRIRRLRAASDPERAKLVEAVVEAARAWRTLYADSSAVEHDGDHLIRLRLSDAVRALDRARFLSLADSLPDPGTSLLATAEVPRYVAVPADRAKPWKGYHGAWFDSLDNARTHAGALSRGEEDAGAIRWDLFNDRAKHHVAAIIDTAPPVDTASAEPPPALVALMRGDDTGEDAPQVYGRLDTASAEPSGAAFDESPARGRDEPTAPVVRHRADGQADTACREAKVEREDAAKDGAGHGGVGGQVDDLGLHASSIAATTPTRKPESTAKARPAAIDAGAREITERDAMFARTLLVDYLRRRHEDNPDNPTFDECEPGVREAAVRDLARALAASCEPVALAPTPSDDDIARNAVGDFVYGHAKRIAEQAGESWGALDGEAQSWFASQVHDVLNNLRGIDRDGEACVVAPTPSEPAVLTAERLAPALLKAWPPGTDDDMTAAATCVLRHLGPVRLPAGEPVAWGVVRVIAGVPSRSVAWDREDADAEREDGATVEPLYRATPAERVTVEEIAMAYHQSGASTSIYDVLRRHVGHVIAAEQPDPTKEKADPIVIRYTHAGGIYCDPTTNVSSCDPCPRCGGAISGARVLDAVEQPAKAVAPRHVAVTAARVAAEGRAWLWSRDRNGDGGRHITPRLVAALRAWLGPPPQWQQCIVCYGPIDGSLCESGGAHEPAPTPAAEQPAGGA